MHEDFCQVTQGNAGGAAPQESVRGGAAPRSPYRPDHSRGGGVLNQQPDSHDFAATDDRLHGLH
mgnify:CR=1 FL=1